MENTKKDRPICPQCGQQTIVLFTPPKDGIVGTDDGYNLLGTPEYVDWTKAHLYCCNGETNCSYEAYLFGDNKLTTP